MPEADKEGKNFFTDIPQRSELFYLKGSNELDWGMKNRLARIFNPEDGRTIMLAIDHGYFQGPTTGLERIDVNIMNNLIFQAKISKFFDILFWQIIHHVEDFSGFYFSCIDIQKSFCSILDMLSLNISNLIF